MLFVVSDSDLDERYTNVAGFVNNYGDAGYRCADAIRSADLIACQTDIQQKMLSKRFGRDSVRFPNPFDHDDWLKKLEGPNPAPRASPEIQPRFALWIGRSDRHHKRPEILLQVAGNCPAVRFIMVMNTTDEAIAADVRKRCPSNVQIIERVPLDEIPRFFRQSAVFISTGSKEFEGFPNVFLQAAATAVPIVSLEADPGFIADYNAGVVCHGDLDQLVCEVKALWDDTERAKRLGQNGQRYVSSHHSAADTRNRLLQILDSVL